MALPEQHQGKDFGSVSGNNDSHDARRDKDAYNSEMKVNHPAIRPQNNWKARGSGSDHGEGPRL